MLTAIRTLYDYNAWANTRVLDIAGEVDRELYVAPLDGSGSIRDVLVHTAAAQWVWLQRWRGGSSRALWDGAVCPDVPALRARWAEVENATAEFVAALTASDLEHAITYVNFQGETWSYPLWQALIHQVNHATQHRSEAALLLSRLGHSPGDLDVLVYVDELTAAG